MAVSEPSQELFKRVADQLEAELHSATAPELSSIVEMAQRFGVAYSTMWKAVRELSRRGVITTARGRKSRVRDVLLTDSTGASASVPATSAGDLCIRIERMISQGTYKVGHEFPKTALFVYEQHVSAFTVSEAMHLLARKNLAHKRGRRWFVGPSSVLRSQGARRSQSVDQSPTVLVITHSPLEFPNAFENGFTSPFLWAFRNEITGHGTHLQPAAATGESFRLASTPIGLQAIRRFLDRMGDRHLGTLVMTNWPEASGLMEMIPALMRSNKPLFFFDSVNNGAGLTRSGLEVGKKYFRGYFDEPGMVDLGVKTLAAAGHTKIGVLVSHNELDWVQRRVRLIAESCARLSPRTEVFCAEAESEFWTPFTMPDFDSFLQKVSTPSPDAEPKSEKRTDERETILANTPSLARMLRTERPTALVALNDNLARQQYLWLRTLGVRVPQDISLLSFDNMPHSVFFPYTTIDPGFSNLGYIAARLILGDIPSPADADGNIPGVCTLIDRGSVRAPGMGRRMLELLS